MSSVTLLLLTTLIYRNARRSNSFLLSFLCNNFFAALNTESTKLANLCLMSVIHYLQLVKGRICSKVDTER